MARNKATQPNIDNSDTVNFPDARIKNNTGAGDGTAVNEATYGDMHEFFAKIMRLYGISYNGFPDSESNGYQYVEALKSIASKNDFILNINTVSGKLNVAVKLSKMLVNEQIVCKATTDLAAETEITGLEGSSRAITFIGNFKAGEYVRLINTSTTIVLVRLVDSVNLDTVVTELAYLKAATYSEEIAGLISTKSTTPLNNALSFVERVNGTASDASLASLLRNGLLSKEDKLKIDELADVSSLIKIDYQTNITVTSWTEGDLSANYNFNYIDVYPPTGKTMDNLVGFMASHSKIRFDGDVDDSDVMWCSWQEQTNKIRLICGSTELEEAPRANYIAIWI